MALVALVNNNSKEEEKKKIFPDRDLTAMRGHVEVGLKETCWMGRRSDEREVQRATGVDPHVNISDLAQFRWGLSWNYARCRPCSECGS